MRRNLLLFALILAACDRRGPPGAELEASAPASSATPSPTELSSATAAMASAGPPAPSGTSAARPPAPAPEKSPPAPAALVKGPPRPATGAHAGFRGPVDASKDGAWLERLASGPIAEIVRNTGGATLTLRVRFADGSRAVFKPEQKHSASNYRAEIAAYHVDRLLGFGRTAAVVGRSIGFEHLLGHLEHSGADEKWLERFQNEVISKNGRVSGAMIAWHAGRLANAEPPKGWTAGLKSRDPVPESIAARLPEWSDLMVFDFVIDNTDRWSGGNVLSLGTGGPLIFLDNASSFAAWRASKGETTASLIEPICRFRRATLDALVAVGPAASAEHELSAELRRSLAKDPLAPVLGESQLTAVDRRIERLLQHIDQCKAALGEQIVLLP